MTDAPTPAPVPSAPVPPALVPPAPAPPVRPTPYAVVGTGWRAQFFLRMAGLLPDWFVLDAVVSRSAERGAQVTDRFGAPTFRTVADLLAARRGADRPAFVVLSVPWEVNPVLIAELVRAEVPVLAETPPAPDVPALRRLWGDVGPSGLVQVAEHSPFLPGHQARAAVVDSGVLGRPTSVHVSSTHQYHAVALIRRMLGVGFDPVEVVAREVETSLMNPRTRAGWTGDTSPTPRPSTLAILELGPDLTALYDFTENQPRTDLRRDRILVRGTHGELSDDRVDRWVDPQAVVTSHLTRRHSGLGQDMERYDLEHIAFEGRVVHRNPFLGARLSEDEAAVATLMARTAAWACGEGEPPYPLAQGSQDHLVGRALVEAARTRRPVRTEREVWAD